MMSARLRCADRSRVPVWHWVTVADDHDLRALDLHAVLAEQGQHTVRGAGQRGGLVEDEPAEVHGVKAVGVLVRVHELQDPVLVDALGKGQLDDVPRAGRVLVQFADDRLDLVLRRRGRQFALDGGDADLRTVTVLAGDVLLAAGVVPDEDRAEAGRDALLLQRRHAGGQIGLDRGCGGLAIENLGGHGPILADDPVPVPIRGPRAGAASVPPYPLMSVS
jgi:hypothetical protein